MIVGSGGALVAVDPLGRLRVRPEAKQGYGPAFMPNSVENAWTLYQIDGKLNPLIGQSGHLHLTLHLLPAFRLEEEKVLRSAVDPTGRWLVTLNEDMVVAINLAGKGEAIPVAPAPKVLQQLHLSPNGEHLALVDRSSIQVHHLATLFKGSQE